MNDITTFIHQIFKGKRLPEEDRLYSEIIPECTGIYRGEPPWSEVKRSGLYKKGSRQMNMLNMAKILCDEMSALTFSEQTSITVSDEKLQEFLDGVLSDNGFYKNIPTWLSYSYALGGGVLKIYTADKKIAVEFLYAHGFYTL